MERWEGMRWLEWDGWVRWVGMGWDDLEWKWEWSKGCLCSRDHPEQLCLQTASHPE